MNIEDVFRKYGVHYVTQDSKVTAGWLGMKCIFCSSPGFHLGVNLSKLYWRCWRCGHHGAVDAIAALCHVSRGQALEIYRGLDGARGGASAARRAERDAAVQRRVTINRYRRPSDVDRMGRRHRAYLEGRGFDPDEVERVWEVCGTGPASYLDQVDYRYRLFVPVLWRGREVSFQARDVTGRSEVKYRACPMGREAVHHKAIVYAHPDAGGARVGIVVEGVVDCWRLGPSAVATFGTQYKREQVLAIAKLFDRVAVVFDAERPAQRQASMLVERLNDLGTAATVVRLPGGDPGELSPDDASHLVAEVGRWGSGHPVGKFAA